MAWLWWPLSANDSGYVDIEVNTTSGKFAADYATEAALVSVPFDKYKGVVSGTLS